MTEEKKIPQDAAADDTVKKTDASKPAEPVEKTVAPAAAAEQPTAEAKSAPAAPAQPAQSAATPAAEKEKAPVEKVTPTNCVQCNKSIKKIRWYYRDGKYYCTKRCWMTAMEKAEKKATEGQAPEAK